MQNEKIFIPAQVWTELDKMNLLDRFLFNETVEDTDIYNAIVEILTDGEITMTERPETEKELRVSPQLRQIRLDVISMDEEGTIYQMEMQKENTYNLRKRSRFYQSQIDVSLLEPGCTNFNQLNDVTTILVAPFDIFGYNLYRYTFEEYCQEIPQLKLEDGARRIFINTLGKNPENFSQEFLDFMKYINESTDKVAAQSESARIQKIHKRVRRVRASEKMGVKFMQRWEEIAYAEQKARTEGYTEGRYQLEMQKENTYNLRKRSRFYQSQIDVSLLEPGCTNFNQLNDVTTILVAPFDIFGYNLYRYTFEEYCQEIPQLKLEDGARRIFINTLGKNPEKFSQEFLDFMKYINESTDKVAAQSESARIQKIHKRVRRVRASEKMGVKFMQRWEEIAYAEQKARTEGYTEGQLFLSIQQVCRKLTKGLSTEEIAENLELDISKVKDICEAAKKYAPDFDVEKITKELLNKS